MNGQLGKPGEGSSANPDPTLTLDQGVAGSYTPQGQGLTCRR